MISGIFLLTQIIVLQTQTDFKMDLKLDSQGHSYLESAMPNGIKLKTLDGTPYTLAVSGPTLIQVWSVCCGGESVLWADQRLVEEKYAEKGLRVVSINFENGKSPKQQINEVNTYFETMPRPGELYLDALGYVVDDLPVKGFPTYILVKADGTLHFRTSGKSVEGVILLEQEIENILADHD